MGELRNSCKILFGISARKSPLRRSRDRREVMLKWVLRKQAGRVWIRVRLPEDSDRGVILNMVINVWFS
jgi:hypothetical protein